VSGSGLPAQYTPVLGLRVCRVLLQAAAPLRLLEVAAKAGLSDKSTRRALHALDREGLPVLRGVKGRWLYHLSEQDILAWLRLDSTTSGLD
jgi:predicted DNA-binding transcriptional regulator